MSELADPLAVIDGAALRARLRGAIAREVAAIVREWLGQRDEDVIEHRPSGTVRQVADDVGLSPTRVQQITTSPTPPAVPPHMTATGGDRNTGTTEEV